MNLVSWSLVPFLLWALLGPWFIQDSQEKDPLERVILKEVNYESQQMGLRAERARFDPKGLQPLAFEGDITITLAHRDLKATAGHLDPIQRELMLAGVELPDWGKVNLVVREDATGVELQSPRIRIQSPNSQLLSLSFEGLKGPPSLLPSLTRLKTSLTSKKEREAGAEDHPDAPTPVPAPRIFSIEAKGLKIQQSMAFFRNSLQQVMVSEEKTGLRITAEEGRLRFSPSRLVLEKGVIILGEQQQTYEVLVLDLDLSRLLVDRRVFRLP